MDNEEIFGWPLIDWINGCKSQINSKIFKMKKIKETDIKSKKDSLEPLFFSTALRAVFF